MRILLFLFLTLILTTQLKSQTYTISRETLGLSNYSLKCKYPNLKFQTIDDVATYSLKYNDGNILFVMSNGLVENVVYTFYNEDVYRQFVECNKKFWFQLSASKYEDIRYQTILILQDIDNNGISMVIVKLKNK